MVSRMVYFIRASALGGFAALAASAGADPVMLCEAVGIPGQALSDPDMRIRLDSLGTLLDLAARRTGIEDFALRMAVNRRPSAWGAVGLLMMQQKTVGDAFAAAIQYMDGHAEGLRASLELMDAEAMIRLDISHDADALAYDRAQINELLVAASMFVLRRLMKRDWKPVRVSFTHAAKGNLERYRPYFGGIPLFDQDCMFFTCARSILDQELDDHDPEAERVARRIAEQHMPTDMGGLSRAVALTIAQRLPGGGVDAETIAHALDLDLRTLQRRLAAEGASFSNILDATRRGLASTYVDSSRRPLTEVADLLGFSSSSAFSQWYAKVHGFSAAERRAGRR